MTHGNEFHSEPAMRIRCLKGNVVFVLMLLVITLQPIGTDGTAKDCECLNFRGVLDSDSGKNVGSDYEYGRDLYPRYPLAGLSSNFLVRKRPDISLCSEDLKLIEISREPLFEPTKPGYVISLHLQSAAATRINQYTKTHIGKQIATGIGEKIQAISVIMDEIKDVLEISVANRTLQEIQNELMTLCREIRVHDDDKVDK
jgi:hypothetical protein